MVDQPPLDAGALLRAINFREELGRLQTERETELKELFLSLLEVLDSMDRIARSEVTSADGASPVGSVRRQFLAVLARAGLQPIECLGESLDPHVHEVAESVRREGATPNTIVEVIERGFTWNDQVLRRPRVVVNRQDQGGPE